MNQFSSLSTLREAWAEINSGLRARGEPPATWGELQGMPDQGLGGQIAYVLDGRGAGGGCGGFAPICKTCGQPLGQLPPSAPHKAFCSTKCRMEYHGALRAGRTP